MLAKDRLRSAPILLVPGQAEVVSRQTGDDVVVPVPIDVVGIHFRSAVGVGESHGVESPGGLLWRFLRLLKPAGGTDDVGYGVPVDVADSKAMPEPHIGLLIGNAM